jgi:hypothetical protein
MPRVLQRGWQSHWIEQRGDSHEMTLPAVVFVTPPAVQDLDTAVQRCLAALTGLMTRPTPEAWALLQFPGGEAMATTLHTLAQAAAPIRAGHIQRTALLHRAASGALLPACHGVGEALGPDESLTPAKRAAIINALLALTAQQVPSVMDRTATVSLDNASLVVAGVPDSPEFRALYLAVAGASRPANVRMSRVDLSGINLRQPGGRAPRVRHMVRLR